MVRGLQRYLTMKYFMPIEQWVFDSSHNVGEWKAYSMQAISVNTLFQEQSFNVAVWFYNAVTRDVLHLYSDRTGKNIRDYVIPNGFSYA